MVAALSAMAAYIETTAILLLPHMITAVHSGIAGEGGSKETTAQALPVQRIQTVTHDHKFG